MDPEKTKLVDRVKPGAPGRFAPLLPFIGESVSSGHSKEVARSRRRLGTTSAEKLLGKEQLLHTWEGGNHDHPLSNGCISQELAASLLHHLKSVLAGYRSISRKSNLQNYQLEMDSS